MAGQQPQKKKTAEELGGPLLRKANGRCAALVGQIGKDVKCSIYDRRPTICKALESGSWACRAIRQDNTIMRLRQNINDKTDEEIQAAYLAQIRRAGWVRR